MIKTAAAELTDVNCRALDVDLTRDGLAAEVVQYALAKGPTEIGLGSDGPQTVVLESDAVEPAAQPVLGPDDLVVITGGARGVTAEVAVALAEAGQPRLILLGRSPEPTGEPDWLVGLSGEAEIKRAIVERAEGPISPRRSRRSSPGCGPARRFCATSPASRRPVPRWPIAPWMCARRRR